jgi:hypothetical protein
MDIAALAVEAVELGDIQEPWSAVSARSRGGTGVVPRSWNSDA